MTQIRFRTDNSAYVAMRSNGLAWADYIGLTESEYLALEPGRPGDIWLVRWYAESGEGPLAGYVIWCPKCDKPHHWTTATNCEFGVTQHTYKKADGSEGTYNVCGHSGVASCWDWTGSAEEGTLTAHPSLLCHTCGYHGWLKGGMLEDC